MCKKDLQKFHIIKVNENIRSKVRSNFVIPNIPVERMRIDNCYSLLMRVMLRRGFVRKFKVNFSGVQSYFL